MFTNTKSTTYDFHSLYSANKHVEPLFVDVDANRCRMCVKIWRFEIEVEITCKYLPCRAKSLWRRDDESYWEKEFSALDKMKDRKSMTDPSMEKIDLPLRLASCVAYWVSWDIILFGIICETFRRLIQLASKDAETPTHMFSFTTIFFWFRLLILLSGCDECS